jgi:hypothetical protein
MKSISYACYILTKIRMWRQTSAISKLIKISEGNMQVLAKFRCECDGKMMLYTRTSRHEDVSGSRGRVPCALHFGTKPIHN